MTQLGNPTFSRHAWVLFGPNTAFVSLSAIIWGWCKKQNCETIVCFIFSYSTVQQLWYESINISLPGINRNDGASP
jgi:hypothetical protein